MADPTKIQGNVTESVEPAAVAVNNAPPTMHPIAPLASSEAEVPSTCPMHADGKRNREHAKGGARKRRRKAIVAAFRLGGSGEGAGRTFEPKAHG